MEYGIGTGWMESSRDPLNESSADRQVGRAAEDAENSTPLRAARQFS